MHWFYDPRFTQFDVSADEIANKRKGANVSTFVRPSLSGVLLLLSSLLIFSLLRRSTRIRCRDQVLRIRCGWKSAHHSSLFLSAPRVQDKDQSQSNEVTDLVY